MNAPLTQMQNAQKLPEVGNMKESGVEVLANAIIKMSGERRAAMLDAVMSAGGLQSEGMGLPTLPAKKAARLIERIESPSDTLEMNAEEMRYICMGCEIAMESGMDGKTAFVNLLDALAEECSYKRRAEDFKALFDYLEAFEASHADIFA